MTSERNIWVGFALLLVLGCGDDDAGRHDAGEHDAGEHDAAIVNAANNPFPCLNPMPASTSGGLLCASGQYIQPRAPECPASDVPASDACRKNSDCSAGMYCWCASPDSGLGNSCQPFGPDEDCSSSEECEPGFHCASVTIGFSDWAISRLRCQTPLDECAVNSDCVRSGEDAGFASMSPNARCQADSQGRVCCDPITWTCER